MWRPDFNYVTYTMATTTRKKVKPLVKRVAAKRPIAKKRPVQRSFVLGGLNNTATGKSVVLGPSKIKVCKFDTLSFTVSEKRANQWNAEITIGLQIPKTKHYETCKTRCIIKRTERMYELNFRTDKGVLLQSAEKSLLHNLSTVFESAFNGLYHFAERHACDKLQRA